MRISPRLLFIRLFTFIALGASAALMIDYVRPTPAFCSLNSGCEEVLSSDISQAFVVPLPAVGLVAFSVLLSVSLGKPGGLRRFLTPLAVFGGVVGLGLILIQFLVIGAICWLCFTVDTAAIATAVSAGLPIFFSRGESSSLAEDPDSGASDRGGREKAVRPLDRDESPRWIWISFGVLVVGLAVLSGFIKRVPRVPEEIKAYWQPGKVTVVEILDFECLACRRVHPVLKEVLKEYGNEIHLVRLMMPMSRHPNAADAARAYFCAEEKGKAVEMADLLFSQTSLAPELYQNLAATLDLNVAGFNSCMKSRATHRRLEAQIETVRRAGLGRLPTICVQDQMLFGIQTADTLHAAIRRAKKNLESSQ